ncbi:MAG: galactonate dehydratase [Firmicutes bacterium]|uniref:Galactonate dehydratase n=1 Tax=Melghirimyces thermohalophilus TaxID=1236220 RepID=A0A1G6N930_9BACL|nr:galactonate dehydratase [Melghirimyces thermohalophilus]MDA8352406.1 galactonate dehydratase [Bacillota bacterium]SDC64360.1 galactonate dehydratase [Melghirimyces thermohalophilus]
MKITGLKLYQVPPRWLFLKLQTDEGVDGWGEPVVEGRADTVAAAVRELEPYLLGQDPNRIEDLWQTLYRGGFYRGGPVLMSAIAGIDQALWDIKGKRYGLAVYEFLGGAARDKVQVYSWIGGDRPSDVGESAREKKEAGFRAIKMNATEEMHYIDSFSKVEAVLERVDAVRKATGRDFGIAVDFHGRVHKPMAKVLAKELEPYHLLFIEEPVLPEHNEALREIAHYTSTPIATGERMYSRWDFKKLFEQGVVDIIQPDLSHAGGITEVKKIAAMAEAYDVAVAPHCPLGPVALAACLQLDAATPNVFIQEQSLGIHYNQGSDLLDYLKNREVFRYESGRVAIPDAPGLGVTLDEEVVEQKAKEGHQWKNPVWRRADGTVAEW